jgi:hypothetical protein
LRSCNQEDIPFQGHDALQMNTSGMYHYTFQRFCQLLSDAF